MTENAKTHQNADFEMAPKQKNCSSTFFLSGAETVLLPQSGKDGMLLIKNGKHGQTPKDGQMNEF